MSIRVNMATSLDGKIATTDRGKIRLGSDADIRRIAELRTWADVLMIGAETVRAEDPPMELNDTDACLCRRREGREEHPAVAVVTGSLNLPVGRTFRGPGRRLVVTTDRAPDPTPQLRAAAEIWRVGDARVDVLALVERLAAEGLERILVEGGGKMAANFFEHDLVEELFLTITPYMLGGDDAPTLADAAGVFESPPRFDLVDIESTAEEIFLRYRRHMEAE